MRRQATLALDHRDIITIEPDKRGGKPCIRRMRITVYDVLGWLASGMSIAEIIDDFPELTETDIRGYLENTLQPCCRRLKRQGYGVNHKRVARLMRELGLMGKAPVKRKRTTNSQHDFQRYPNRVMNLEVERPDEVWVGDITYIRLQQEFVYLAVLMDVFTRSIRGWHLARSMDQSLTLTALTRGLEKGIPEIHHSDQGVQYAPTDYVNLLKEHGVQISMAEVGQAWQNGYAERLMRTIKEEEVDLSEYRNFTEAYQQIEQFLEDVYMKKRIHSLLGYLTPEEYEQKWNEQ